MAVSFVQRPEDIDGLLHEIGRLGSPKLGIVLRIDTKVAFSRLPDLRSERRKADGASRSAGVVIARGDLGVEVGFEGLSEVQEERSDLPVIVFGVLISLAGPLISVCYQPCQAKLFPTAIRFRANGIGYSASRVGAMKSGFLIGFLLRYFGVTGVFASVTASMLVVVLLIGVFGPRTNGLRREEINH